MAADDDTAPTKQHPIPRARWSEDWSGFMENAPLTSQKGWRPDKYMALGTKGDSYLSIGGEYRLAYESMMTPIWVFQTLVCRMPYNTGSRCMVFL